MNKSWGKYTFSDADVEASFLWPTLCFRAKAVNFDATKIEANEK